MKLLPENKGGSFFMAASGRKLAHYFSLGFSQPFGKIHTLLLYPLDLSGCPFVLGLEELRQVIGCLRHTHKTKGNEQSAKYRIISRFLGLPVVIQPESISGYRGLPDRSGKRREKMGKTRDETIEEMFRP